ncbi:MAG: hypothetical protein P8179_20685 [Candidatus Thiodiazotropha sp.]|jgi:hypothetical protein
MSTINTPNEVIVRKPIGSDRRLFLSWAEQHFPELWPNEIEVEFEPWHWAGDQTHKIIGTEQWNNYWSEFLNEIGICPIHPGSWNIPISILQEPYLLKKLISLNLNRLGIVGFPDSNDQDDITERLLPFNGGYILWNGNNVLFKPQCCCDLGDINYWKEISGSQESKWHRLSMGHGMMEVRRQGRFVEIKENPEHINHEAIIESVKVAELNIAIDLAYGTRRDTHSTSESSRHSYDTFHDPKKISWTA